MFRTSLAVCGCLLVAAAALVAAEEGRSVRVREEFNDGAARWETNDPKAWEVIEEEGNRFFRLKYAGKQEPGKPRRPTQLAILKDAVVGDFTLTARMRCERPPVVKGRDLIIVFGYTDPLHYYYAHLSNTIDPIHNAMHIVNNADRKAITRGKSQLTLVDDKWHTLKLVREVATGKVSVFIDGAEEPALTAADTTFKSGRIGFGSFDDFGSIDDVELVGTAP